MASKPVLPVAAAEEMERENLLLKKQVALVMRQAEEVREECHALQARLQQDILPASRESFSLVDFLPDKHGTPPVVLAEAIRFYETHDGCPFHEGNRCNGDPVQCNGVWIRMGHPCWQLVARVKEICRALRE